MKNSRLKYFVSFMIVFLVEVIIAVFVHDQLIRPYLGDILVVVCVYLLCRTIFLKKFKYLSFYVLIFAIFVEILQYFNLAQVIAKDNQVIKIILGSTFDIKDIICYVIGYILIVIVERKGGKYKNEY